MKWMSPTLASFDLLLLNGTEMQFPQAQFQPPHPTSGQNTSLLNWRQEKSAAFSIVIRSSRDLTFVVYLLG